MEPVNNAGGLAHSTLKRRRRVIPGKRPGGDQDSFPNCSIILYNTHM